MNICILALDGVFDTGLSAMLDTFAMANEVAAAQGRSGAPLSVQVVGVRQRLRTAHGLTLQAEPLGAMQRADWVVVPALNAKRPELLLQTLARRDVQAGLVFLRRAHAQGVGVAAACIGTFLLAEAGLLNGLASTTSWSLAPLFRQRYPQVNLDEARMLVASPRVVTAGAMMGHLDLALWLVRQASPELAATVARFMLVDNRTSQAPYIIPDYLVQADPLVTQFERWSRQHLAQGFSLQAAALALHVHPRTLQRRLEQVLGKSPLALFQDLRIERAKELVSAGHDLASIAGEVGYADASTLGNLLRRKLGRGVREIRAQAC